MKGLHLLFSIILIAILAQGANALSITVVPENIIRGDQVTISISDLLDNSTFSMQIEGTFATTPGGTFSFETKNLVLPFALNDGALSATLRNTDTNTLIVKKGDTEVRKVGLSQNGIFSTSDSGSIPPGTYDTISLGGTAAADAGIIIASMTLQGKKSGPSDSVITFVVEGVTDGQVAITIHVDGATALSRTITIGNPVTQTPTQASHSTSAGGGGTSVSATTPTAKVTTQTTQVTTTQSTVQTSPPATNPSPADTAAPAPLQTSPAVPATEPQVPPSPSPIGSPLPLYLTPLAIAFVLLVSAVRRR